jgi:hypothetical protein
LFDVPSVRKDFSLGVPELVGARSEHLYDDVEDLP